MGLGSAATAPLSVSARRGRLSSSADPVETWLDETYFEPARTRCGTRAWDAAVRDGNTLSFEDAIAYALEEPRAQTRAHRQAAT
jgi:hypothetical protein